ncbi:MAG: hypothetical protein DMF34_03735 [Verrucomicrobia bacterium]|nr:MAG: hypothetical protein DMF34_03735 [Verrucomicrobiota bacterium]
MKVRTCSMNFALPPHLPATKLCSAFDCDLLITPPAYMPAPEHYSQELDEKMFAFNYEHSPNHS